MIVNEYQDYAFYKQLEEFHQGDLPKTFNDVAIAVSHINFDIKNLRKHHRLMDLFVWNSTPQGRYYWYVREHGVAAGGYESELPEHE